MLLHGIFSSDGHDTSVSLLSIIFYSTLEMKDMPCNPTKKQLCGAASESFPTAQVAKPTPSLAFALAL